MRRAWFFVEFSCKMSQNILKIAVADTAIIVRMGVLAALKRVLGSNTVYLEMSHPEDFETKVMSFSPSVIVVSPSFGGTFDVAARRKSIEEYAHGVKFVALVSCVVPASALAGFDAQLSIYDTEDDLLSLFTSLSRAEEKVEAEMAEGESEALSAREKQVVKGVVSGLANKEIADQMNISVYTVLTHRRNIARKLNIHSSIALAIYAISNKLVTVDEVKE